MQQRHYFDERRPPAAAEYYRRILGFRAVEHLDKEEPFVALYRGGAEIILTQAARGPVRPNHELYGSGCDAYLVTGNAGEDVDALYAEFKAGGADIVHPPALTDYGNYEFVLADTEQHWIAVGRIRQPEVYFGGA